MVDYSKFDNIDSDTDSERTDHEGEDPAHTSLVDIFSEDDRLVRLWCLNNQSRNGSNRVEGFSEGPQQSHGQVGSGSQ